MNRNNDKKLKMNIVENFLFKLIAIVISFTMIPMAIHYLGVIEYGIWVTLFSVMNWINVLDIGIGLGLRNKLAESIGKNNLQDIREYISTGFVVIIGMGLLIFICFFVGIQFVSLQMLFNTREISEADLYMVTLLTGSFVIMAFVMSIINQIYYAYQQAAVTGAIQVVHNFIMLISIYYLMLQANHQLLYFVISFGIATFFSRSCFIICFFKMNYHLIPKLVYVRLSKIKSISNLGIRFFIIQIACVLMFSSSNILITQCLGVQYVRSYDIVFKIFSVVTMAHSLICMPLWSAYTDAYVKDDFEWMKAVVYKMIYLMLPIIIGTSLILWKIEWIIKLWIGNFIELPLYLSECMALFVIISCWNNIWAVLLNGIGKLNVQMYMSIGGIFFVIPVGCWLMGVMQSTGMILAIDIILLIIGLPQALQVKDILTQRRSEG